MPGPDPVRVSAALTRAGGLGSTAHHGSHTTTADYTRIDIQDT
jgi:hypothetical protein